MQKSTPLLAQHQALGGQLINFHGWRLPLHYGSQIEEHHSVRQSAGMFDVSHMTIVDLLGAGGRQCLLQLLANDVDRLTHPGCAMYSCMLNHNGGIIDDLIVYCRAVDSHRLILNAATRDQDLAWIQEQTAGLSVGIQERTDLAMIAIQGPDAINNICQVIDPALADAITTLRRFECVDVGEWFIARTGYTGEDGLEIVLPQTDVEKLWESLIDTNVKPCGLGCRDSLRLEAGLLLYGQDMDESTSPYESGLDWTVALEPQERDFIGRAALELQVEQGVKHKLVGLTLEKNQGVLRAGQKVLAGSNEVGVITSGNYSPTLDCSIALARVPSDLVTDYQVEIRSKKYSVKVGKPRFVKNGQAIGGK